ncbi:hypothetical protein H4R19_000771 [Coemansia spiralis]|nr:hypothetical protein H4R19_000771 [Coemansia spiralis]
MRIVRELLQLTADTHRIRFTPAALAFLDRAPMDLSSAEHQSSLQLAGVPLAKYTPKIGRMTLCDPSRTAANYKRRRPDWVAEAEHTRWRALHHTPLEPKHVSLLWQLQHMSPDNTDKCPACGNMAANRSTLLPAPEHREDLARYFYDCARVRRFWLLEGRFFASTLRPRAAAHRSTSRRARSPTALAPGRP